MYRNIGNKIKSLATFISVLGIVIGLITGGGLIFFGMSQEAELLIIIGIPVAIVLPVLSWIGGFFMYGFGELINETSEIKRYLVSIFAGGDNSHAAPAPAPAPTRNVSSADRRKTLEDMYSKGIITDEEYRRAIQEIYEEEHR